MALRRPRTTKPAAVTASVANIPLGKEAAWNTWRIGGEQWQREAWRLYDITGELRFLSAWIGDSVSQARLYVTELENGEEKGETSNPVIKKLAASPLGSGAQRDDNLRLLGTNLAICGEAWIVGENAHRTNPDAWYVLTPHQIRHRAGKKFCERPMFLGGGDYELTDGRDIVIRCWRPHPNRLSHADSPTRSAIPNLKEIELLTKREFAEIESRLTGAGMLFIPEGFDFPTTENGTEGTQGLVEQLQEISARNIQDQSSASAVVPIMLTIPDHMVENIDKIKPLNFWSELSSQITEMKEKAIGRVAASFEIPSELLGGLGSVNHWGAWAISEEGLKRIKPYLGYIADALTRGFLIPALERAGIPSPATRFAYAFDVAPLSVRPNRLPEALDLWDRGLLSTEETVKAGAFTADQIPDDKERLYNAALRAIQQAPSLLTEPAIQEILGISTSASSALPPTPENPRELPPTTDPQTTPEEPDNAPLPSTTGSPGFAALSLLATTALTVASARLTTNAERIKKWPEYPRWELHARVGEVSPDKADKVLDRALDDVPRVAKALKIPTEKLHTVLYRYCHELLVRGIPHHDELLAVALKGWAQ
jgi:hypothetical protein